MPLGMQFLTVAESLTPEQRLTNPAQGLRGPTLDPGELTSAAAFGKTLPRLSMGRKGCHVFLFAVTHLPRYSWLVCILLPVGSLYSWFFMPSRRAALKWCQSDSPVPRANRACPGLLGFAGNSPRRKCLWSSTVCDSSPLPCPAH